MSWVEDARKLMQDFVAPELRAISVRLDAAEKMDSERDKIAAVRHAVLLDELEANRREFMLNIEFTIAKSRIADLEAEQKDLPASAAGAGMIDRMEGAGATGSPARAVRIQTA